VVWKLFNDAFDYLPLAAVVNRKRLIIFRVYLLPAWRTVTGYPHPLGHRRSRPRLRNTDSGSRGRPDVVRPLIDLKLGHRVTRSGLAIRMASHLRVPIAQLAEIDRKVASVGLAGSAGVVQGQESTDGMVGPQLLLSLWECSSDNEGAGGW
jgi:hypothetical protein